MKNLKNSITFLFLYLLIVFGLAQVNFIEANILNFAPVFFILLAGLTLAGMFAPTVVTLSIYTFILSTAVVYGAIWVFVWQPVGLSMQLVWIQFLLVMINSALAFNVGLQIAMINSLLEGLAATAYPNRSLDLRQAMDRVGAELTRSRRYQHPLSLIIVELGKDRFSAEDPKKRFGHIEQDLLRRFALARVSQVITDRARETDLILRDQSGRFILLCPETPSERSAVFADRIARAVNENLGSTVNWAAASFPDEALTFDELLERAELRLSTPESAPHFVVSVDDDATD